jgi:zinc transport system substrate-binding protein
VLVSVPPQAWLAERIAGDLVDLRVMVPPGASPQSYEPTMTQMREVHRAALYGALGHPAFPFERAWLPDIREAARSMEVVDTGAGCSAGGEDPHIWLDPECALRMTDSLEAALARLLPAEAQAISEGAASTRERIRQVEAEAREILAPHRGRSFMVFHPAWGHFARSFGLRQVAIEAEGKAPSPAELQRLVRRVSEESIGVVFVQPQFSREAAEIVAAESNARVIALDPLRRDWDAGILEAARELAASFGTARRDTADRGRAGS